MRCFDPVLDSGGSAAFGFRKRIRGVLKRLFPYSVQRDYAFRTYGIFFPDCVTWGGLAGWLQGKFWASLPFGFVCLVKGFDPDVGCQVNGTRPDSAILRLLEHRYRLSGRRRFRFLQDRKDGLEEFAATIKRNCSVRILVVLHLYYGKSWSVIREYLTNLAPYGYDLIVTYISGRCTDGLLREIRSFDPDVRLVQCENRGFDIWPFVSVLNETDLTAYDIVFKLHSKGIGRPFIFIYGQIFKYADWFFNLFDGVLGGKSVHQVVDTLVSGRAALVAAENLLVADPRHKRNFVRAFCEKRGLSFSDEYRFVAGTCFAVRAECLVPLRMLGLSAEDFATTGRGEFSLAHVIERWMCFSAMDRVLGIPVEHPEYRLERESCASVSALRLLDDPRFELDDDFVYRVLESRNVMMNGYDVRKIRLGDIRRMRHDGSVCRLEECEPYLCLKGNEVGYEEYCRVNRLRSGFAMTPERFRLLRANMEKYDPRRMPVVRGEQNIILDGQHRCCILLDRFGPDYEIEVVSIW